MWRLESPECAEFNLAHRYVSSDLKDHPVGHQAWFHRHSNRFTVHAYMVGVCDGSTWEQRIRRSVTSFTVASSMSDVALAHAINKAAIDVLVSMNGWTAGHRMGVMSLQPAPISIEWMGGHDTTGADYITYIVSDRVASPPEFSQPFYSEAMMMMPHSFFMNEYRESRASVLSNSPPPRSSLALPPGPLLCNFNQLFKLDPLTLTAWARLLRRVPQAHLWLLQVVGRGQGGIALLNLIILLCNQYFCSYLSVLSHGSLLLPPPRGFHFLVSFFMPELLSNRICYRWHTTCFLYFA